ncbi:MAG TPA: hypothetical protein VF510_11980 [Ktedonobacterales bacterium]
MGPLPSVLVWAVARGDPTQRWTAGRKTGGIAPGSRTALPIDLRIFYAGNAPELAVLGFIERQQTLSFLLEDGGVGDKGAALATADSTHGNGNGNGNGNGDLRPGRPDTCGYLHEVVVVGAGN